MRQGRHDHESDDAGGASLVAVPANPAGRARSELDDDEGGVVGGAHRREQVEEERVRERFGGGAAVVDEGVGQTTQAGVDVLVPAAR